ncbi:hypothetical protein Vspart_03145 [Vibrio spartinae]|uniref:Uncharacterized protein n=1 Tax=Vibrio spartinae TaxID=1918945 RepID=A0ABX6R3A8_9VIBR|nr:hypothetical protein Vspart_03145 [Vibrio spartinae]
MASAPVAVRVGIVWGSVIYLLIVRHLKLAGSLFMTQMNFNFLLRLRVVYWYLCSNQLKQEPSVDWHAHAFMYVSLIVFAFLYGGRSIIFLLFNFQSFLGPFTSVIGWATIAGLIVYLVCVRERYYLQGKLFLEQYNTVQKRTVCIRNGFFLLFLSVLPQISSVIFMLLN